MQEQRFRYAPRMAAAVMAIILGLVFVGACGLAWAQGWTFRLYTLDLTESQARLFYALGILLGAVLIVAPLISLVVGRHTIVVGPGRLTLPKHAYTRRMLDVDPASIRELRITQTNGVDTLVVSLRRGNVKLHAPYFDSREAFAACVDAIHDAGEQRRPN